MWLGNSLIWAGVSIKAQRQIWTPGSQGHPSWNPPWRGLSLRHTVASVSSPYTSDSPGRKAQWTQWREPQQPPVKVPGKSQWTWYHRVKLIMRHSALMALNKGQSPYRDNCKLLLWASEQGSVWLYTQFPCCQKAAALCPACISYLFSFS